MVVSWSSRSLEDEVNTASARVLQMTSRRSTDSQRGSIDKPPSRGSMDSDPGVMGAMMDPAKPKAADDESVATSTTDRTADRRTTRHPTLAAKIEDDDDDINDQEEEDRPLRIGDFLTLRNVPANRKDRGGFLCAEGVLDDNVIVYGRPSRIGECVFQICIQNQYSALKEYHENMSFLGNLYASKKENQNRKRRNKTSQHQKKKEQEQADSEAAEEDAQVDKLVASLERSMENEKRLNEQYMAQSIGKPVTFGMVVQLLHVKSNKYLTVEPNQTATQERENLRVYLSEYGSSMSWLTLMPWYKIDREGDSCTSGSSVLLRVTERTAEQVHCSEEPLKAGGYSEAVEVHEANSSLERTGWKVVLFSAFHDASDSRLHCGDVVRLVEPELNAYLRLVQAAKVRRYDCVLSPLESMSSLTTNGRGGIQRERKDSSALWVVESFYRPTLGGVVNYGEHHSYRLRHLNTGKYLCMRTYALWNRALKLTTVMAGIRGKRQSIEAGETMAGGTTFFAAAAAAAVSKESVLEKTAPPTPKAPCFTPKAGGGSVGDPPEFVFCASDDGSSPSCAILLHQTQHSKGFSFAKRNVVSSAVKMPVICDAAVQLECQARWMHARPMSGEQEEDMLAVAESAHQGTPISLVVQRYATATQVSLTSEILVGVAALPQLRAFKAAIDRPVWSLEEAIKPTVLPFLEALDHLANFLMKKPLSDDPAYDDIEPALVYHDASIAERQSLLREQRVLLLVVSVLRRLEKLASEEYSNETTRRETNFEADDLENMEFDEHLSPPPNVKQQPKGMPPKNGSSSSKRRGHIPGRTASKHTTSVRRQQLHRVDALMRRPAAASSLDISKDGSSSSSSGSSENNNSDSSSSSSSSGFSSSSSSSDYSDCSSDFEGELDRDSGSNNRKIKDLGEKKKKKKKVKGEEKKKKKKKKRKHKKGEKKEEPTPTQENEDLDDDRANSNQWNMSHLVPNFGITRASNRSFAPFAGPPVGTRPAPAARPAARPPISLLRGMPNFTSKRRFSNTSCSSTIVSAALTVDEKMRASRGSLSERPPPGDLRPKSATPTDRPPHSPPRRTSSKSKVTSAPKPKKSESIYKGEKVKPAPIFSASAAAAGGSNNTSKPPPEVIKIDLKSTGKKHQMIHPSMARLAMQSSKKRLFSTGRKISRIIEAPKLERRTIRHRHHKGFRNHTILHSLGGSSRVLLPTTNTAAALKMKSKKSTLITKKKKGLTNRNRKTVMQRRSDWHAVQDESTKRKTQLEEILKLQETVALRAFFILFLASHHNPSIQMHIADALAVFVAYVPIEPMATTFLKHMLQSNMMLQETKVSEDVIEYIVKMIEESEMEGVYVDLLRAFCACQNRGVSGNQCAVVKHWLRKASRLQIRVRAVGSTGVIARWSLKPDGPFELPKDERRRNSIRGVDLLSKPLPRIGLSWDTEYEGLQAAELGMQPVWPSSELVDLIWLFTAGGGGDPTTNEEEQQNRARHRHQTSSRSLAGSVQSSAATTPTIGPAALGGGGGETAAEALRTVLPLSDVEEAERRVRINSIARYLVAQIYLAAEVCLDRNYLAIGIVQERYDFETCIAIIKNDALPDSLKAAVIRLVSTVYVDRDPSRQSIVPHLAHNWSEIAVTISESVMPDRQPQEQVYSFLLLQDILDTFFASDDNSEDLKQHMMELLMLLVRFSFYSTSVKMQWLVQPLVTDLLMDTKPQLIFVDLNEWNNNPLDNNTVQKKRKGSLSRRPPHLSVKGRRRGGTIVPTTTALVEPSTGGSFTTIARSSKMLIKEEEEEEEEEVTCREYFSDKAWHDYFYRPESRQAKLYDFLDGMVAVCGVLFLVLVALVFMWFSDDVTLRTKRHEYRAVDVFYTSLTLTLILEVVVRWYCYVYRKGHVFLFLYNKENWPFNLIDMFLALMDIGALSGLAANSIRQLKSAKMVRIFKLVRIARAAKAIAKLSEVKDEDELPSWVRPLRYSSTMPQHISTMLQVVTVFGEVSLTHRDSNLSTLLSAFKYHLVNKVPPLFKQEKREHDDETKTASKDAPEPPIMALVIEEYQKIMPQVCVTPDEAEELFVEVCNKAPRLSTLAAPMLRVTSNSSADLEEAGRIFDEVILDLCCYDDEHLVQASLNLLMMQHSVRRSLLLDVTATGLLTTPAEEALANTFRGQLQELRSCAEQHELWGSLLTEDDRAMNNRVKRTLRELTGACMRRRTLATTDAPFEPIAARQTLLANLGALPATLAMLAIESTISLGVPPTEFHRVNTCEILELCCTFLMWFVRDHPANQRKCWATAQDLLICCFEHQIGAPLVLSECVRNNPGMAKAFPTRLVVECAHRIFHQGRNMSYLHLLGEVLHSNPKNASESNVELQFAVLRELTRENRAHVVLNLCNDHNQEGYKTRLKYMREGVTSTQKEQLALAKRPTMDLAFVHPELRYQAKMLEVLSACALGSDAITTVEAKLQKLYDPDELLYAILDPRTSLQMRCSLAEFLLQAVIDVEITIPNFEKNAQVWRLFGTFGSAMERTTLFVQRPLEEALCADTKEGIHARLELKYSALCSKIMAHFLSRYLPLASMMRDLENTPSLVKDFDAFPSSSRYMSTPTDLNNTDVVDESLGELLASPKQHSAFFGGGGGASESKEAVEFFGGAQETPKDDSPVPKMSFAHLAGSSRKGSTGLLYSGRSSKRQKSGVMSLLDIVGKQQKYHVLGGDDDDALKTGRPPSEILTLLKEDSVRSNAGRLFATTTSKTWLVAILEETYHALGTLRAAANGVVEPKYIGTFDECLTKLEHCSLLRSEHSSHGGGKQQKNRRPRSATRGVDGKQAVERGPYLSHKKKTSKNPGSSKRHHSLSSSGSNVVSIVSAQQQQPQKMPSFEARAFEEFVAALHAPDLAEYVESDSVRIVETFRKLGSIYNLKCTEDLRAEPLYEKLVEHTLSRMVSTTSSRKLDDQCTKTTTWLVRIFREMVQQAWGMTIETRNDEGTDMSDKAAYPVQKMLNECGVTTLCLNCISRGIDPELKLEAVKLCVALLFREGGNVLVQREIFRQLQMDNSDLFFLAIKDYIAQIKAYFSVDDAEPPNLYFEPEDDPYVPEALLAMRFLQLMAEGHFEPNQDIMREKQSKDAITCINLLDDFVELLSVLSRDKNRCRASAKAARQVSSTILEVIQGPCKPNQLHLAIHTELIEILNRIMRSKPIRDCYSPEEDDLKQLSLEIFEGLLEGERGSSVITTRIISVIDLDVLKGIIEPTLKPKQAKALDESGEELMAQGSNNRELDSYLSEIQIESLVLLQMFFDFRPLLRDQVQLSPRIQRLLGKRVTSVEILWNGRISRRFFPVPDICEHISDAARTQLIRDVDRATDESRLQDFLKRADEVYRSIKHQAHLKDIKVGRFNLAQIFSRRNQEWATWIAFVIACLINLVLIFYARHSGSNGVRTFDTSTHDRVFYGAKRNKGKVMDPRVVLAVLNAINILLSSFTLVLFVIVRCPVKYAGFLEAGRNKYYSLFSTMTDAMTMYYLFYTILAIMGAWYRVCSSFLLLDIVIKSPTSADVLNAVFYPRRQLAATLILAVFVVYIFALVTFQLYPDKFDYMGDDDSKTFSEDCRSLRRCFIVTLMYGFRLGAGIGEIMTHTWGDRLYLDFAYFIILLIVLMNIIFGIIIDTFGELRVQKQDRLKDTLENCFICGLEGSVFDRAAEEPGGFRRHCDLDHNTWDYLHFIIFIWEQDKDDDDGVELYVRKLVEQYDVSWLPIGKAIALSSDDLSDELSLAEQIVALKSNISTSIDDHQMKFLGTLERSVDHIRSLLEAFEKKNDKKVLGMETAIKGNQKYMEENLSSIQQTQTLIKDYHASHVDDMAAKQQVAIAENLKSLNKNAKSTTNLLSTARAVSAKAAGQSPDPKSRPPHIVTASAGDPPPPTGGPVVVTEEEPTLGDVVTTIITSPAQQPRSLPEPEEEVEEEQPTPASLQPTPASLPANETFDAEAEALQQFNADRTVRIVPSLVAEGPPSGCSLLSITVHSAVDLVDAHLLGTGDPFIFVRACVRGKAVAETQKISMANSSAWPEGTRNVLYLPNPTGEPVTLELWHCHRHARGFFPGFFLGHASLEVDTEKQELTLGRKRGAKAQTYVQGNLKLTAQLTEAAAG